MKNKNKLYPGDEGYPGGTFTATIYVDGKVKEMKTVKDAYGNVIYVSITDKILGIF